MAFDHWVVFIELVVASAIFYRLGGRGGAWWGNTKMRDLGVPLCCMTLLTLLVGWSWWNLASCIILSGALTTYWKTTPTARWWNWALTGLGYSLAMLPAFYGAGHAWTWVAYTLMLTTFTTIWSEVQDNVVWEECGRGAAILAFLPVIAIH